MTADRKARLADAKTWAGYRSAHFARQTGTLVVVVEAEPAGVDSDPANPWATVCDDHGSFVTHGSLSLALAHASDPAGWCMDCQEAHGN